MKLALLALTLLLAAPAHAAPHVYLLERSVDGVKVAEAPIAPEQTRVFPLDANWGTIAVILPDASGIAPRVIHSGEMSAAVVRLTGDTVYCDVRLTRGDSFSLPAVTLGDLARQDTRMSVVGGDGTRAAFVIRGWASVERDTVGPALEPFAAWGPLVPGEWSVCANSWSAPSEPPLTGRVSLEVSGHLFAPGALAGGSSGAWMVDLGAGISMVRRRSLPAGRPIGMAPGADSSSAGADTPFRFLDVAGVGKSAGLTTLPTLTLGSLVVEGAPAAVVETLPWSGRTMDGVLGLDAMRRGRTVVFEFPANPGEPGALELGATASHDEPWARTPMAMMGSFVVIGGRINGHPVHWILDTGAPESILDYRSSRDVGLTSGTGEPQALRGLGGSRLVTVPVTIPVLELGDQSVGHVPCHLAALPIFRMFRTPDHAVGLLGLDFLTTFRRIEIDFEKSEVRWFR